MCFRAGTGSPSPFCSFTITIRINFRENYVQNQDLTDPEKRMSGRSKPPSVLAAFSSAPNPDGNRASCCPVLACTRRDSPFHRILFVNAQRVTRMETMLLAFRLDRIMTENRPCRFCSIAVTLATRTCVRLRAQWVGGLSSATVTSPSAALSLSHSIWIREKISAAHACTLSGRIRHVTLRVR